MADRVGACCGSASLPLPAARTAANREFLRRETALDPRRAFSYSPASRSGRRSTQVGRTSAAISNGYPRGRVCIGVASPPGCETLRTTKRLSRHGGRPSPSHLARFAIAERSRAPGRNGVLRPPGTLPSGSFFLRREGERRGTALLSDGRGSEDVRHRRRTSEPRARASGSRPGDPAAPSSRRYRLRPALQQSDDLRLAPRLGVQVHVTAGQ